MNITYIGFNHIKFREEKIKMSLQVSERGRAILHVETARCANTSQNSIRKYLDSTNNTNHLLKGKKSLTGQSQAILIPIPPNQGRKLKNYLVDDQSRNINVKYQRGEKGKKERERKT